MSAGPAGAALTAERSLSAGPFLLAVAIACALLLALPGQTVATRYLPDLLLLLDHAHRVTWGQVPARDFDTPLGPLVSYVAAAGYALSGHLGGAMPVGMALVTLVLAPAIAHILLSRLQPVLALSYGAFLILIVAVPMNLGEGVTALSFAKFYNRIGWAAIGALLILYLRPRRVLDSDRLDALAASFLTLVMIYTKATYGLAAFAFLLCMLSDQQQRRWAAGAIGLTLAAALAVELAWRSSAAHVADLRLALEASGPLRGTWGQIADHLLGHLADYILATLFVVLALRRTRSGRDALFYGLCGLVGFLLINQNFQVWGIVTLHAAAAVAAETILRHTDDGAASPDERRWSVSAGVKLVFIALVLPTIVHCTLALGLHAVAASARAGDPIPFAGLDGVRFANLWTWGDHDSGLEYLAAVKDGVAALERVGAAPERVVVLDGANPFSAALGIRPPKGDMPWLQWERTIGPAASRPAEDLLADAAIVMEPKPPAGSDAARTSQDSRSPAAVYGPFLAAHFDVVLETERWTVHRRRPPDRSGRSSYRGTGPLLAGSP